MGAYFIVEKGFPPLSTFTKERCIMHKKLTCTIYGTPIKTVDGFYSNAFLLNRTIETEKERDVILKIFTKKVWCHAIDDFTVNRYGISVTAQFVFDRDDNGKIINDVVIGSFCLNMAYLEESNELVRLYETDRNQLSIEKCQEADDIIKAYNRQFDRMIRAIIGDCMETFNDFDDEHYYHRHNYEFQK